MLHWLTAVLVLAALVCAWVLSPMPYSNPLRGILVIVHASCGVSILLLTAIRIVWRVTHQVPRPAGLNPWQLAAARVTHALLYALLFLQPLTGYMMSISRGQKLEYFFLVPFPALVERSMATYEAMKAVHVAAQWPLYGLLLLHVGAALHHHLVIRDGILTSMLPDLRGRRGRGALPSQRLKS